MPTQRRSSVPSTTPSSRSSAKLLENWAPRTARRTISTCSCWSRPSARASPARECKPRISTTARSRRRARTVFVNIEALGGRARGALLVRRQQARVRQAVSRQGTECIRDLGRARQGRRPAGGARHQRAAQHRGRPLRPAPRRSASRRSAATRWISRPCSRRAKRSPGKSCSIEAARQADGHHHGERRRGVRPCSCSSPTASISCRE